MLDQMLSASDERVAAGTMRKLFQHDVCRWALTGGLAVEYHAKLHGDAIGVRFLNDIDFVVDSFERIPHTLANDFQFLHVHPYDPIHKTLVQMVAPDYPVRLDVFRTSEAVLNRAVEVQVGTGSMRVVSAEDLVAHLARLLSGLAERRPVASKHARDFLRLVRFVEMDRIETAWADHREPQYAATFKEARTLVERLVTESRELLITPVYSTDTTATCARCHPTRAFKVADPKVVISLLGYC